MLINENKKLFAETSKLKYELNNFNISPSPTTIEFSSSVRENEQKGTSKQQYLALEEKLANLSNEKKAYESLLNKYIEYN